MTAQIDHIMAETLSAPIRARHEILHPQILELHIRHAIRPTLLQLSKGLTIILTRRDLVVLPLGLQGFPVQ